MVLLTQTGPMANDQRRSLTRIDLRFLLRRLAATADLDPGKQNNARALGQDQPSGATSGTPLNLVFPFHLRKDPS